ncbi:DUF1800 domain-containing protein [bacterium]|nr:DUF1800 domain-containing protein [bacterium]
MDIANPTTLSSQITLAEHAANRLMFGPRPGDIDRINAIGFDGFVEQQLDPASIDDTAAEQILNAAPRETLSETMQQLYDRKSTSPYAEVIRPIKEVQYDAMIRAVESKRQLHERMVNFWYDHFNLYGWDYLTRSIFPTWDALIHKHALGNFHEFLIATAQHTSMLLFLDNYKSTDGGPNENYARELIELHTLGAMNYNTPDGYTDEDVYETSRCFTGWNFDNDSESPTRGEFLYRHDDHDRFQKWVLGVNIPRDQAPTQDGLDVLSLLANHPGTAKHIAWKLAQRFISDDPPESVVESTAAVFHANVESPDQLKQTMKHLLTSDEFKSARRTKFKRPFEWAVSMLRALEIPYPVHEKFRFEQLYDSMGQPLYSWSTPEGAPDIKEHWATSNVMIRSWRMMFETADGWYLKYGYGFDPMAVMPGDVKTAEQISDFWIRRLISGPVSQETRDAIVDYVAEGRNPALQLPGSQIESKTKYAAALCAVSPEFMMR